MPPSFGRGCHPDEDDESVAAQVFLIKLIEERMRRDKLAFEIVELPITGNKDKVGRAQVERKVHYTNTTLERWDNGEPTELDEENARSIEVDWLQ